MASGKKKCEASSLGLGETNEQTKGHNFISESAAAKSAFAAAAAAALLQQQRFFHLRKKKWRKKKQEKKTSSLGGVSDGEIYCCRGARALTKGQGASLYAACENKGERESPGEGKTTLGRGAACCALSSNIYFFLAHETKLTVPVLSAADRPGTLTPPPPPVVLSLLQLL